MTITSAAGASNTRTSTARTSTAGTSRAARLAVVGTTVAVAFWAAKAVAIGLAGGSDDSLLVNLLYLAGLAGIITGTAGLAVALTSGRHLAVRILAGVAGPVLGFSSALAVNALLAIFKPADASWVWEEINLWVIGLVALLLAITTARRSG